MLYPPTNSPILIFSTFDTPSKSSQTTKRPARAKALIINAFALAGRFAFINPYTQGGALGYELIGLSARIIGF